MTTSVSPTATRPFAIGLAAIAGLALGVLTVVGQDVLPGLVVGIANSAVVWSLFAFVAGALARSEVEAAFAGAAVLVGAVVGYYVSVPILVEGAASNVRSVVIWGAVAGLSGPVLGIAGRWWRSGTPTQRVVATAVPAGLFVGEGLRRLLLEPPDIGLGWAMVGCGIATALLSGRSTRERGLGVALAAVVVIVLSGAFWLVEASFRA